jgi:hypothetical protein
MPDMPGMSHGDHDSAGGSQHVASNGRAPADVHSARAE